MSRITRAIGRAGLAVVGLLVLLAASVRGLPSRLPVSSESRLDRTEVGWMVARNSLTVQQIGDSVTVRVKGHILPDWRRRGDAEAIIPVAAYQAFWDSLELLGFWRLKDSYGTPWPGEGAIYGELSVSWKYPNDSTLAKTVRFHHPEGCSVEFRRVYHLFQNLARYVGPPGEKAVNVAVRPLSTSEVIDILREFPGIVPDYLASKKNDTSYLAQVFRFSEVMAAPLKRVFPTTRFYLGSDFALPPHPYLMAIAGDKSYGVYEFNQLLLDNGMKVTDKNMLALAKALTILTVEGEYGPYPQITLWDAAKIDTAIGGITWHARLNVNFGERVEVWHFARWHDGFGVVSRGTEEGKLITQYDLPQAEPSPKR